jgi:hypothetical protein
MSKRLSPRLSRACKRWQKTLWIGDWDGTFEVIEGLAKEITSTRDSATEWTSAYTVAIKVPYKSFLVKADREIVAEATDEELDEHACHEMIHVVLEPMKDVTESLLTQLPASRRAGYVDWLSRENEGVTEHLTKVLRAIVKKKRIGH